MSASSNNTTGVSSVAAAMSPVHRSANSRFQSGGIFAGRNRYERSSNVQEQHQTRTLYSNPLDDVDTLVHLYQSSGGKVPLAVLVAQVAAVQQAATRLAATADSFTIQLQQLDERAKLPTTVRNAEATTKEQAIIFEAQGRAKKGAAELRALYNSLREEGISRFTPLLQQTVDKYTLAFESLPSLLDGTGELLLAEVARLCDTVCTRGRQLRQPLPSSRSPQSLDTLMQLVTLALAATPVLKALVQAATRDRPGCEIVMPSHPTKKIGRVLQKAFEEYDGDYTRILDFARVSIVCNSLKDLTGVLNWLLHQGPTGRFRCCRTKDRLSRRWDAEMSGGNRDVMLNGYLDLGAGNELIVEIQLHLRCLFDLKSELHVLYAGARVLGAMDDATAIYKGALNHDVLRHVTSGIVRKLHTSFSILDDSKQQMLKTTLQTEPCSLLELNLDYSKKAGQNNIGLGGLEGWSLSKLMVPPTGTLACRRLRKLQLSTCGLVGRIPSALSRCALMTHLVLGRNKLTGPIPEWITDIPFLVMLKLNYNKFTGSIPSSLRKLKRLQTLHLQDNQLTGIVPCDDLASLTQLKDLLITSRVFVDKDEWAESASLQEYMKRHDLDVAGNTELIFPDGGKQRLRDALPHCRIQLD